MNKSSLFVLLIIAVSISACKKEDCQKLDQPDQNIICTTEFKPVCGCDGETYSNSCKAEAAGVSSYRAGRCL